MMNGERLKVKIIDEGKPNPNLFCEVSEEALKDEFGGMKLFLYIRNDGKRIATVTENDVHVFAMPDGRELGMNFERVGAVRILPGYEREICLAVEELSEVFVVSLDDCRDAEPEQLIEIGIAADEVA